MEAISHPQQLPLLGIVAPLQAVAGKESLHALEQAVAVQTAAAEFSENMVAGIIVRSLAVAIAHDVLQKWLDWSL